MCRKLEERVSRVQGVGRYPTSLTDAQWLLVQPILTAASRTGLPRRVNLRAVVDAICYRARTGCQWRMLPSDLPPWQTVYFYFRRWDDNGTWEQIRGVLHMRSNIRADRRGTVQ